ncbi:unnamed protein product [Spirodela intermedia]|uniref:Uncharacterized protein n=1 Tax=Spirodela intermedia TaxID=51605 RepID=A0A7I8J745_SPIIN|nr:unnamed protein product [Spirodela intermedia]CAA6665850.1 unnamed protein product [Spirodela intermedia]
MAVFMFINSRRAYLVLLLSLLITDFSFLREASCLGINYGQVANNLPPPDHVLALLTSIKISKARIYDTNPQILSTFATPQALQWVMTHVKPYFPATKISGIAVGNEVYTTDDPWDSIATSWSLLPIPWRFSAAPILLCRLIPARAGQFYRSFLQFLAATGSPFWINAYPYFAYKEDPNRVSLGYALLNPNAGLPDPYTRLNYDNMLYAQVDAVIFAMAKMGFGGIEVRVSETGWPSKGDPDEVGATAENAEAYNRNLLLRQLRNEGTPLRPNQGLDVYLFALFNEDLKPGPTSERNYGLYQPTEAWLTTSASLLLLLLRQLPLLLLHLAWQIVVLAIRTLVHFPGIDELGELDFVM